MKAHILALSARPKDKQDIRLESEFNKIDQILQASPNRDLITFKSVGSVTPRQLLQLLSQNRPAMVHFSGHGTKDGSILLEDERGNSTQVTGETLRCLFKLYKSDIRLLLLNACHSSELVPALSDAIDCIVGMNKEITDRAATTFSEGLYSAIGRGGSVENAFESGIVALRLAKSPETDTPTIKTRPGIVASELYIGQFVTQVDEVLSERGRFIDLQPWLWLVVVAMTVAMLITVTTPNAKFLQNELSEKLPLYVLESTKCIIFATLGAAVAISITGLRERRPIDSSLLRMATKLEPTRSAQMFSDQLELDFKRTVYGGLLGGAAGGTIISALYWLLHPNDKNIIVHILWFSLVSATSWSYLVTFCNNLLKPRHDKGWSRFLHNEVTASVLGSVLPGVAFGALGGVFFGMRRAAAAEMVVLAPGVITAGMFIWFAMIFYYYQGTERTVNRAARTAALCTVTGIPLAAIFGWSINVEDYFFGFDPEILCKGGVIVGLICSVISGLTIGLPLYLHRRSKGPIGVVNPEPSTLI